MSDPLVLFTGLVVDSRNVRPRDSPQPPRVARAFDGRRALFQRARRMVGPRCFANRMGPPDVSEERGIDVGPHPHGDLLIDGEAPHRDSPGSQQVISPGQLNLMTGHSISHAEETTGHYSGRHDDRFARVASELAHRDTLSPLA